MELEFVIKPQYFFVQIKHVSIDNCQVPKAGIKCLVGLAICLDRSSMTSLLFK